MRRIGIVGLGFAGAALALSLRRVLDAEIVIFERTPAPEALGAGVLLQPSGQAVLAHLGLLGEVISQSEPIERIRGVSISGRTIVTLPYRNLGTTEIAYGVHRGVLFSALFAALKQAGITLRCGAEVTQISSLQNSAVLKCANDQEEFSFIAVTNGTWSSFRKLLGLERWAHDYAYGALWAVGRSSKPQRELLQRMSGTSHLAGLLPMGNGRCSFFWGVRADKENALRQIGIEKWRQQALTVCPEAEELLASITELSELKFTRYRHAILRAQHYGRVICLGDAAHPMSPHLGQGANLALLDAARFAWQLTHQPDFDTACRAFTYERKSQVRYYSLLSLLLSPFFQSDDRMLTSLARDLALPLLSRTPWVRTQMALTMAGLKAGFIRGRLARELLSFG